MDKKWRTVIKLTNISEVVEWRGKNLNLINVRREEMGAFMCIANNQVPPAVSRRVVLNVRCKSCLGGLDVFKTESVNQEKY